MLNVFAANWYQHSWAWPEQLGIFLRAFFVVLRVKRAKELNQQGKKSLSNYMFCANQRYFIGNDRLTWNRLFQRSVSFRMPFINVVTAQKKRYLSLRKLWVTIMTRRKHRSSFLSVCHYGPSVLVGKNFHRTSAWFAECHFSIKISCP